MRWLAFLFSMMTLVSGCSDDTTGGADACPAGYVYNPISRQCAVDTAPMPDADDRSDAGVNDAQNNNPNNTVCVDCGPFFFSPDALAFSFTPAHESSLEESMLHLQTDLESTVESIEIDGSDEFQVVNLRAGDIVRSGVRAVTVQYSPRDNTPDTATIRVHLTNSGVGFAELKVSSTISGTDVCSENCPRIQVEPLALNISYQPGDAPSSRPILVGSVGQAPLEVREILVLQQGRAYSISHDMLPLTLRENTNTSLTVNFDPSQVGASGATVKIRSNDPFQPEVNVPITATAKDSNNDPCIQVAPTSLNFGTVVRGNTVTKQFTITNCGALPLNVSNIERGRFFGFPTSAAYQITSTWTQGTIGAGDNRVVDITYSPRRAGLENGFFLVRNDDPSNAAVRVNVNGVSESPPIQDQDIHIKVKWDANETDVDTHVLLLPGTGLFCNNDCYFQNPQPDWGTQGMWEDDPFLDVDDVDGYGPENVNIAKGIDGMTYRVVLHYWRDSHNASSSQDSNATVELYIRGTLIQTWGPKNLASTGATWNVFEIDWPSRAIRTFNDPIYSVPSSTSCRPTP